MATLTFWGVRGSFPTCSSDTIRYGGNTSCVSIEHGASLIILDAGTGIRSLGKHLLARGDAGPVKGCILLTHQHWDHIQGLPFFAPAFSPENRFVVYGERKRQHLVEMLEGQMQEPYSPIGLGAFEAEISFVEVAPGEEIKLDGDVCATALRLNHPNEAIGYVLEIGATRVAYITDHEHEEGQFSPVVLEAVQGADVLIHDAQYSREQLAERRGWGHSAWEDVVELALQAGVRRLFLFHHDPDATDNDLDRRLRQVQERFPGALLAREGLTLPLMPGEAG